MMIEKAQALRAAWILPINGEPKKNSTVLIEDGKILNILPANGYAEDQRVHDYGSAIIVPGLINLHTHLEYSSLFPFQTDEGLLPWTRSLMQAVYGWQPSDWLSSARKGASLSASLGTSFVVDSSYTGAAAQAISEAGLRGIVGLELFGIDENAIDEPWDRWLEKLARLISGGNGAMHRALSEERLAITIAPHAPYTVCPGLWKRAAHWAQENSVPLLTHLAESQEERNWFLKHDEQLQSHLNFAFAGFRQKPPLPEDIFAWKRSGFSPVEHLERHGLLNADVLAAHALAISEWDIAKLVHHNVPLALCPRSNARLRNGHVALEKMRSAGLRIGLGTDSLASTDNLSMLAEARFAVTLNRAINPQSTYGARQALKTITIDAARCLNMNEVIGSIEPGKEADLAIFQMPPEDARNERESSDPYETLLYGDCKLLELFVAGKSVYRVGKELAYQPV